MVKLRCRREASLPVRVPLKGGMCDMTIQQQAYGLIDRLPDDSVQVMIQVMRRMLPYEKEDVKDSDSESPKMKAYMRMQE